MSSILNEEVRSWIVSITGVGRDFYQIFHSGAVRGGRTEYAADIAGRRAACR